MRRFGLALLILASCGSEDGCSVTRFGFGFGPTMRRLVPQGPAPFTNAFSVDLDGTDEHLTCGDLTTFDGATQVTISFWLNINPWMNAGIIAKNNSTHFELRAVNNGSVRFYFPGAVYVPTTTGISVGWHHFVATYNAGTVVWYVDGAASTGAPSGSIPVSMSSNNDALIFGGTTAAAGLIIANIDEVTFRVAHVASAGQAAELYNGGDDVFDQDTYSGGAPDNWWRMGDGATHPTIPDESGSFDCTMVNTEADDIAAEVP